MEDRKVFCKLAVLMAERDPHLSQRQLARELELSPTTINQLFGNKFKRIDVETVEKLCKYFQCEIGELFILKPVKNEG
ncbi:MAG: helix-turn-helix transcriptional regulator [Lyngbya sp.]|nr:helix-turn-helix transcriptional regulator [Lyngbya sp.]